MASMKCQPTTETCHGKENHGHSLTDKVKDMAHSATKMFEHKNHQENSGEYCHRTHTEHGVAKTHTTDKKKEGQGGNFIANIGEHMKNMTSKKKNKKNRAGNCNDSSSDSSSSDENDDETCEKKN